MLDTSNGGACNGDRVQNEAEDCEGTKLGGATFTSLRRAPNATGAPTYRAKGTSDASRCGDGKPCTESSCTTVSGEADLVPSLPPFEKSCDSCMSGVRDQDSHGRTRS